MRRALAAAALVATTTATALAGSGRDSNGHFHEAILVFAPLGAECTATRDGAVIFHQVFQDRPAGSQPPSIDADIAASRDDIELTCSLTGQPPIEKVLKWGVQLTPFDTGPPACGKTYAIDEDWPTTCRVISFYAYPDHVRMGLR